MPYNGHKNWNHWNVSLWLFNDETMYTLMTEAVSDSKTLDEAATRICNMFGGHATPDGAPYTFTSIRAALVGWDG